VANKIWEIEDGKIKEFEGTYLEWEEFNKRRAQNIKDGKIEVQAKQVVPELKVSVEKIPSKPVVENKEQQKEEKRVRNQFAKLEEEMGKLNLEKTRLESLLGSPDTYSNPTLFQQTENNYNSVKFKIEQLQPDYEKLFEQLMQYEN
jgi:ATP-binding cassette subfamily F protein 3